jgi:hypothetical protein
VQRCIRQSSSSVADCHFCQNTKISSKISEINVRLSIRTTTRVYLAFSINPEGRQRRSRVASPPELGNKGTQHLDLALTESNMTPALAAFVEQTTTRPTMSRMGTLTSGTDIRAQSPSAHSASPPSTITVRSRCAHCKDRNCRCA